MSPYTCTLAINLHGKSTITQNKGNSKDEKKSSSESSR